MKSTTQVLGFALLSLSGFACKEGTSQAGSLFNPIPPSADANQGCAGMPAGLASVDLLNGDTLMGMIGPESQILGVAGTDGFYLTAGDDSIWFVDVSLGLPPTMTMLVDNMVIDNLLTNAGVTPPIASDSLITGMAILDAQNLLVIEQTSNTLLVVSRVTNNDVSFLAGFPNEVGGNADGPGSLVRFNFTEATQVLAAGDGSVFVADSGNHSIRLITPFGIPESATIAGIGSPLHSDGQLIQTAFDTPTGLTVTCAGELIVTETGSMAVGGHRIRRLLVGDPAFFGGFDGISDTLVGDGVNATVDGIGMAASVGRPVAPLATADEMLYWVDSTSGRLRSCDLMTLQTTTLAGIMSMGGEFSLAVTDSDELFVLDALAGMLYPVIP